MYSKGEEGNERQNHHEIRKRIGRKLNGEKHRAQDEGKEANEKERDRRNEPRKNAEKMLDQPLDGSHYMSSLPPAPVRILRRRRDLPFLPPCLAPLCVSAPGK